MHSVAQSRSIEVFSLDIIKTIVLFFWQYYKIRIIIFSLIPFLLNFLVMFAYVTYIHNYNNNRNNNATIDWQNFKNWDNMKYADYALMLTILLLAFYQFILELLYLFQMRLRYISSFWNLINLLSIGLNVASVVFDYQNTGESQYWIPVSSSAMIIMWLRLFYFGRIINATSTIVRMIIEISKDMIPFLIIVFIIVFGFTNSFFVIATITYDDSPRFTTNNFFLAVAWDLEKRNRRLPTCWLFSKPVPASVQGYLAAVHVLRDDRVPESADRSAVGLVRQNSRNTWEQPAEGDGHHDVRKWNSY